VFRNREEAAFRLAARLKGRSLHDPLVLATPRGGVGIGAVLAHELGAHLDVVLSRKLRAPGQPELALGAVAESGEVFLNSYAAVLDLPDEYLEEERRYQMGEIARRRRLFRSDRPPAPVAGRSVIVTDDGIATGSTLIAALHTVRGQTARRVIAAVPVANAERRAEVRGWCDEAVCLLCPRRLWAVGQFYGDFTPVEDEQVVSLLRELAPPAPAASSYTCRGQRSVPGV
jgi:putative phosphoribosyl transferase